MVLIVEDGTGLATAESYGSVSEADTYHAAYGAPVAWSDSNEAQKEEALRIGTRWLDAQFSRNWKGRRVRDAQALDWVRWGVADSDGYWIASDAVPTQLKHALFVAALKVREGDVLLPDLAAGTGGISRESVKVGPIEESISYSGSAREVKEYPLILRLLADLVRPFGTVVRV